MEDKQKKKERWKRWYAKHGKEYAAKYRNDNKDKLHKLYVERYKRGGLKRKLWDFKRGEPNPDPALTVETLILKFGPEPKCYLTGQPIDLDDLSSYALDHIIPRSRGGQSSLANCGLTTLRANQAKGNMTPQELRELCGLIVNVYDCAQETGI